MKKYLFLMAIGLAALVLVSAPAEAAEKKGNVRTIAAVVNNDAITATDVEERLKLVMLSSGVQRTAEMRQKLTPQVINMLVDERLMEQEAGRLGIAVGKTDIDSGFATLAQQNGIDPVKFRTILKQQGVPLRAMESQIAAQMAWSKVIQKDLRPQVVVNEAEIDAVIEKLKTSVGKAEYLVSEIFLPVGNPGDEADAKQLASRLVREMLQGKVPFGKVAAQFSQSPSARRGGDIGWVQEGQLGGEFETLLKTMKEGDLSEPVRTPSGFTILHLRKSRAIAQENIPSRNDVMQRIGLDRLDRLQRRRLLDLRAEAFIENRV